MPSDRQIQNQPNAALNDSRCWEFAIVRNGCFRVMSLRNRRSKQSFDDCGMATMNEDEIIGAVASMKAIRALGVKEPPKMPLVNRGSSTRRARRLGVQSE